MEQEGDIRKEHLSQNKDGIYFISEEMTFNSSKEWSFFSLVKRQF